MPHSLFAISSASASDCALAACSLNHLKVERYYPKWEAGKLLGLAAVPCGGPWVESAFFSQPDMGRTG